MLNLHLRMRMLHSLLQVFQRTKFKSNISRLVSKNKVFKVKAGLFQNKKLKICFLVRLI
jgi:hypothetical protein